MVKTQSNTDFVFHMPPKAEVDALKQKAESHTSQLKAQEDWQGQAVREATTRCGCTSNTMSDFDFRCQYFGCWEALATSFHLLLIF